MTLRELLDMNIFVIALIVVIAVVAPTALSMLWIICCQAFDNFRGWLKHG